MNQDLQLPVKIQEQIQISEIKDMNLAESIASNFVPFLEEITELTDKLKGLELGNSEHAAIAKRVNIDLGKIRSRKDAVKKEQKDYYLKVSRFIDSIANVNEGLIALGQEEAQRHSKYFERMEAERIAKLKAERNEKMSQYSEVELPNLELLDEATFEKMLENYRVAHEARIKAEKEAEEQRLEQERQEAARQDLLRKRKDEILPWYIYVSDILKDEYSLTVSDIADISEEQYQEILSKAKQTKSDHEAEQERVRIENERLRKEAEEKEKQLQKEREAAIAKQKRWDLQLFFARFFKFFFVIDQLQHFCFFEFRSVPLISIDSIVSDYFYSGPVD